MDRTQPGKKEKVTYNGVEFVRAPEEIRWKFNVQGQEFTTLYNANDTSSVAVNTQKYSSEYLNKPLYIIGNYQEPIAEIYANLGRFLPRVPQEVCLEEQNCSDNFPIKNCSIDNIIYFKDKQENETDDISQDENCIIIKTGSENRTIYTDAFLFKTLGI
jgi:hypothetical protein